MGAKEYLILDGVTYMEKITIQIPTVNDQKELEKLFKITINSAFQDQGVGHLTEFIAEEVEEKKRIVKSFLDGDGEYYLLVAKMDI